MLSDALPQRSCQSRRKRRRWWPALVLIGATLTSCVDDAEAPATTTVLEDVEAVTITPFNDGFLWADRTAGTIRDASGEVLGEIETRSDGQRGLLGLAVSPKNDIFVSYTRDDAQLVIERIRPDGTREPIWSGFASSDGANGGRLLWQDEGLVLGVGTLQRSALVEDPTAPNGKLLRIDPGGPPSQTPVVLSTGWNNPFAFAASNNTIWVADNHPTDGDERLAMGKTSPIEAAAILPKDSAPTGLAIIDDRIYVCSITTGAIYRFVIEESGVRRAGTIATDCSFDVTALPDGSLVYSTADSIRQIDNPG